MTDKLWTAYEAAAATNGILCARGGDQDRWEAEEWSAHGIAIDSRTLNPGDIFVALNDVRDGHDFLDNAFKAGASAALVTKPPMDAPEGKPFLVVRDTLEGLRDLARAAKLRNFGKRIAVTGSAGKTSTKDMLRTMLAAAGEVHAADRSFNNHFGVPLTLARMPMTSKFGVFEIGMNHAGEITPLVNLVSPHAVIITTVAAAHLEFFDNVRAIAKAKAEIFSGIKPGGTAIIPRDNEHFDLLLDEAKQSQAGTIISFGRHKEADIRLVRTMPQTSQQGQGQDVEAVYKGQPVKFSLGLSGEHQAMNALAAIMAALSVGAPLDIVLATLKNHHAGSGRGEQLMLTLPDGGTIHLLDESYNANPASMKAAIQQLGRINKGTPSGRKIAILGDMLELGNESEMYHRAIGQDLLAANIDRLYVTGSKMNSLWLDVPDKIKGINAADAAELAQKIIHELHDGDIIMVKGSNGSKVSLVVDALKKLKAAS